MGTGHYGLLIIVRFVVRRQYRSDLLTSGVWLLSWLVRWLSPNLTYGYGVAVTARYRPCDNDF